LSYFPSSREPRRIPRREPSWPIVLRERISPYRRPETEIYPPCQICQASRSKSREAVPIPLSWSGSVTHPR